MFQFRTGARCGWVYEYDSTYSINQSISVYTMLSSGSCGLSPNMNQNLTDLHHHQFSRPPYDHESSNQVLRGVLAATSQVPTSQPHPLVRLKSPDIRRSDAVFITIFQPTTHLYFLRPNTVSNGMVHWDTGNATLRCNFWDSVGNYLTKTVRH